MTLSEMRRLLVERDLQLTKSLGQNFLHDGNQLRRIVEAAELAPGDKVLEIGPGLGPLTELLLEKADEVLAIEKDHRLVEVLKERFGLQEGAGPDAPVENQTAPEDGAEAAGQFGLIAADALLWLRENPRDWSDWKLVANLPYSVASPLLVDFALADQPPKRITVTLQLEVVQRLNAEADTGDYGVLTLLVKLRYESGGSFKIPRSCFFPEPDVDSGCVTLVRREQELLPPPLRPAFVRLVKTAFSQRRKMMLKLLKQNWPTETLQGAFNELGISLQARAEDVSLAQFVELTRRLNP